MPGKAGRKPGTATGAQTAREAYYRAQTRKLDQEYRVRSGELLEAKAVEQEWARLVLAFRERVLVIPTTARQRGLVDAAGEDGLRRLVEEALTELATR